MFNQKLKAFIVAQGWSHWGVTNVELLRSKLDEHRAIFDDWDGAGLSADLSYLRDMADDRFHPENKLPDVQSIIVLAAPYEAEQKICSTGEAMVARYARGRDYHRVLKKKLNDLTGWLIAQNPITATYASVDSGPTVDRVLAEAAGLGFFGKNSMIIHPKKGSYFFIASLMTNLDMEAPTGPKMAKCGDCTRCIDACPTDAITAPGKIDARKCIAYLTIENKDGIPEHLRPKIGNQIFGCDICQAVCPFNIKSKRPLAMNEFRSGRGAGESLDICEVLAIETDEQFIEKFAGTPIMRAKRRGLLRNACVVAGNSGDASLVPALETVLKREDDSMIKEHAKWALCRLNRS